MELRDFMRSAGLSDAGMAALIGTISPESVRKLRFRARGPSVTVAAAIGRISAGQVQPVDLVPLKRRAAPVSPGARA